MLDRKQITCAFFGSKLKFLVEIFKTMLKNY